MIWQIIRKELWHNKLWMALTLIFILFFTAVTFSDKYNNAKFNNLGEFRANTQVNITALYKTGLYDNDSWCMDLSYFAPVYFFAAAGLGVLIGINQFWMPSFTNTWKFTLHHPITRGKMLALMFVSAAFMIALIAGGSWTMLWLKAKSELTLPPTLTSLAEGWLFTLEGFIVYLAVAFAALNEERWYTTKLMPILLALLTCIAIWMSVTFTAAFIIVGIYMVIVIPIIYRKFQIREF